MEKREIYQAEVREMIKGMQDTLERIRYSEMQRDYRTSKGGDD